MKYGIRNGKWKWKNSEKKNLLFCNKKFLHLLEVDFAFIQNS